LNPLRQNSIISLFLILLSTQCFAQAHRVELYKDEANFENLSNEEINQKKESTLKDEAMVIDTNPLTGIKDKTHYTAKDHHRLSGAYLANGEVLKLSNYSGFMGEYAFKAYGIWWHAFVEKSASTFKTISENKRLSTSTTIGSEARFQRPDESKQDLFSYGAGIGYRFKSIWEWLEFEDLFETIAVFGVKHSLKESYRDLSYAGYGFRADYGIHKRASTSFFYGLKASYNIGTVRRALDVGEISSEGSLALSWFSLGAEIGYYY
jgi:hypothetical protein